MGQRTLPPSTHPPRTPLQNHEGHTHGTGRWELPPRPASRTRERPEPQVNAGLRRPPHGLRNKIKRSEAASHACQDSLTAEPKFSSSSSEGSSRGHPCVRQAPCPPACACHPQERACSLSCSHTRLPRGQELPRRPARTAAATWPVRS